MTSPLPPRRRDTRRLEDLVRHDRQNLKQLGVGFVGGRFPPARPLSARAQTGDTEEDDVEPTLLFANTDRLVAVGPGAVTWRLSHTPADGSLHVYWNGLQQPPTEWALNDNVLSIPDPLGLIADLDVFSAAYAYEDGEDEEQRVTIQMVSNSHADTLALTFILPDGTRYAVPGVNTPGAGPVVEFGYFVLEDMNIEFQNLSHGWTWTWPDTSHIHRDEINGTDGDGNEYTGYRYYFEDGGDTDFNDIIMDVKAY